MIETFNQTLTRMNVLKAIEGGELTVLWSLSLSAAATCALDAFLARGYVQLADRYRLTAQGEALLAEWGRSS